MKTYFDIEKAEAEMRSACEEVMAQARHRSANEDDLKMYEAQARFFPHHIDILKTLLALANEGMDDKDVAMAASAALATIIKSCEMMLPGQSFMSRFEYAMELARQQQAVTSKRCSIKAEPLS